MANSGRKHKAPSLLPRAFRRGKRRADQSFGFALCGSVFRNVRQRQVDHDRGMSAMGRMLPVEKIATQ
jgi:hypothetical protein